MNFEIDREKLMRFLKSGIIVLTAILVLFTGIHVVPLVVKASMKNRKELPIYCVNTKKQQVSLSFDAAWGNGRCYLLT